ncbi:MAG: hypothetical protein ABH919_03705 [bacterium]
MIEISTDEKKDILAGELISEGKTAEALEIIRSREEKLFGPKAGELIRQNLSLKNVSSAWEIAIKLEAPAETIKSLGELKKISDLAKNAMQEKRNLLIREIHTIINICRRKEDGYPQELIDSLQGIKEQCQKALRERVAGNADDCLTEVCFLADIKSN